MQIAYKIKIFTALAWHLSTSTRNHPCRPNSRLLSICSLSRDSQLYFTAASNAPSKSWSLPSSLRLPSSLQKLLDTYLPRLLLDVVRALYTAPAEKCRWWF